MIRKRKKYSRPIKPFEKARIEEEDILLKNYALKSKREVWKALAKINYFRKRAMALVKSSKEEQEIFFRKLRDLGFNVKSIGDALDLKLEDLLERRLSTIVANKGIANTVKQARQMVVHKKILVGDKVINAPSYIVPVAFESKITIKQKSPKNINKIEENPVQNEEAV